MDWQLVTSYFTVKSTDSFCSACVCVLGADGGVEEWFGGSF